MNRSIPLLSPLAGLAVCSALSLLTGCAAVRTVFFPLSTEPARVMIVNMTDYGWRVSLKSPTGNAPVEASLVPRATNTVQVTPGAYAIEQTLLATTGETVLVRTLNATFSGGQTYRWPLMTLLSNPAEATP